MATILYQGHGSLRVTTGEGKVLYLDPYVGEGYDQPADLILVSHQHSDHNQVQLIGARNPGCVLITQDEAVQDGAYRTFDLGWVTVEAVEARNKNHDPAQCVGFVLRFPDGKSVYFSCDTGKTDAMAGFASRKLDVAFLCCDGIYNMDVDEAMECARLIGAGRTVPYHMAPGKLFDRAVAERFQVPGAVILADGEELEL